MHIHGICPHCAMYVIASTLDAILAYWSTVGPLAARCLPSARGAAVDAGARLDNRIPSDYHGSHAKRTRDHAHAPDCHEGSSEPLRCTGAISEGARNGAQRGCPCAPAARARSGASSTGTAGLRDCAEIAEIADA